MLPILEAILKMTVFHQYKNIDILKLGFASPNLTNISLPKSTDEKFYLFTEGVDYVLEKNC